MKIYTKNEEILKDFFPALYRDYLEKKWAEDPRGFGKELARRSIEEAFENANQDK